MRLKNVLEVKDTNRMHPSGAKFLAFHDVTLVPYEPKLIDGSLLSAVEVISTSNPSVFRTCSDTSFVWLVLIRNVG